MSSENWVKIFSILWNNNEELSHLFSLLVNEFKKINFETEVYVPFEAVLRDKGTLLKIEWLDSVCGIPHVSDTDVLTTDVYNAKGDFGKVKLILTYGDARSTFSWNGLSGC